MTSVEVEKATADSITATAQAPLKGIIETALTDSLINEIFHQQNSDGSFPPTEYFNKIFNVNFEQVKEGLKEKGLEPSIAEEVHRLISTASILFYFLYHSQKTKFPVDINAIKQFVSKARAELQGFSIKDDPIMQTYIDKGELAVKYVIETREKYADVCRNLKLSQDNWELYIQQLMGLDKEQP